ncbi:Glycosyltransferase family 9 (Heptosyltransferase) [Paraburkholderia unamae]|uniref:glycosyltransferase family 9 protein n=1 Tax=Paraburkholderia unamae TaxID=219649 RepID=UPI001CB247C0|nr:glycosyltransferase family 9 protein [Paraburkholderia unamae]CAG9258266.1 Glycosyltransferase family 9 (Heptosyltransferase) [Paraburkholderia unamae]
MKIQIQGSIAVALPPPIGDSLIGLVLVNNLVRNGYRPVVFGWVAEQLEAWFPGLTVGYPSAYAGAFDTVIELRPTDFGPMLSRSGNTVCLADLPEYGGSKHMIDRIADIAANVFDLRHVTHSNGLVVPASVQRGRCANRVVIHPTGSHPEKMWSREKFLALADELKRAHLHPTFLVAPGEIATWRQATLRDHEVHSLARLEDVAAWIAESAWFIGNDSGPGHLASSIGVPTLTLFMRRGLARTWRPGWGPGDIVLPPNVIPFGNLKERLWKQLLSVSRVMAHFQALQSRS